MRRPILALAGVSLLLPLAPGVAAQDGPELSVSCVTISADRPAGDWDEFSLQDAIVSGAADVTKVASSADCAAPNEGARCMTVAGAAPAEGWTEEALVGAIADGRAQIVLLAAPEECAQVTRETVDPMDTPDRLPLEVVETGVIVSDFGSRFVAVVTNPNTDTWGAQGLPATVRVFGKAGEEIESTSAFATLLPGQTSAVMGLLTTTARPRRVEVAFEGADFNWLPTELPGDTLRFSGVKTKRDPVFGLKTSGTLHNDGDAQRDGVVVVAVLRDKAGRIAGADPTLLTEIPAGGSTVFEIPNAAGTGLTKVAETEIYYQLNAVP